MEGVAGMMARLRHVPGCSRGGLYGPANIDFRFVYELRLQQAGYVHPTGCTKALVSVTYYKCLRAPLP